MKRIVIPNYNNKYILFEQNDFYNKNPITFYKELCIKSSKLIDKKIINSYGIINIDKSLLNKNAFNRCNKKINQIKKTKFSKKLINLLNSDSKREQIKLLKGLHLNPTQFLSFIFYAFENYNYRLSQYRYEHHHKGLDITKLPNIIHLKKNNINIVGKTELTNGQLKQVVNHRKVVVAKFLENKHSWHCFFLTYKSMKGEEKHNNGQPHLHYISDKWNINRKEVLKQLSSEKYGLPSLPHIDYYRKNNYSQQHI